MAAFRACRKRGNGDDFTQPDLGSRFDPDGVLGWPDGSCYIFHQLGALFLGAFEGAFHVRLACISVDEGFDLFRLESLLCGDCGLDGLEGGYERVVVELGGEVDAIF